MLGEIGSGSALKKHVPLKEYPAWNTYLSESSVLALFEKADQMHHVLESLPKAEKIKTALLASSHYKMIYDAKGKDCTCDGYHIGSDINPVMYLYKLSYCLEYAIKEKKHKIEFINPFAPDSVDHTSKLYRFYSPGIILGISEDPTLCLTAMIVSKTQRDNVMDEEIFYKVLSIKCMSIKKVVKSHKEKWDKYLTSCKKVIGGNIANKEYLDYLYVKHFNKDKK